LIITNIGMALGAADWAAWSSLMPLSFYFMHSWGEHMILLRMILAGLLALTVGACAVFTYEGTAPGRLKGQLLVIWVGEDKFVYWPKTKDPLRFELGPALGLSSASTTFGLV
jgi:hypothetical protein